MIPINEFVEEVCGDMVDSLEPFQRERLKNVLMLHLQDCTIDKAVTSVVIYEGMENQQMVQKFVVAKKIQGLSEKSLKYYVQILKSVFGTIGKKIGDITSNDILVYFAKRDIQDKVSKVTQSNELRVLRSFFSWCTGEELLIRDPTRKITNIKCAKRKKKAFTEIEIERLRDACETNRERAAVELLLSTWCRISELAAIKLCDISESRITIIGKGNKERYVYLNARALVALERYLAERSDKSEYVFPGMKSGAMNTCSPECRKPDWYTDSDFVSAENHIENGTFRNMLHKIGERAGLSSEDVHPHKFRRTGATMALKHGMPIAQVSALLGHASIATTQIYLDITDNDLELAHKRFVN